MSDVIIDDIGCSRNSIHDYYLQIYSIQIYKNKLN